MIVTLPQRFLTRTLAAALAHVPHAANSHLGIIENMSYLELPADGTRMGIFGSVRVTPGEPTRRQLPGGIPMDQNVRIGGDTGKPIVSAKISSVTSLLPLQTTQIAHRIAAQR